MLRGDTRYVSLREPTATLRVESNFVGPFNTNWLYISARTKSSYELSANTLIPFQPDMVTVERTNTEGDTIRWTCCENISQYRGWNAAVKAMVVMSGGVYGGTADMRKRDGDYDIITSSFYTDNIKHEAVHLIPMVRGRLVSATMNNGSSGIVVDMEVAVRSVNCKSLRDLIGGGWQYAFANHAISNSVITNFCEEL